MRVKDEILRLRKLGYTYPQIQTELQCSKGTISYHCGEGQKDKTAKRRSSHRDNQHPLTRKIENFHLKNKTHKTSDAPTRTLNRILRIKIEKFSMNKQGVYNNMSFTVADFLKKIGDNPVCSLTGRPINLLDSRSYQLDHIMPRAKGGDNSLGNCQLTCREANQAKHELTTEEFITLCREVVSHFDNRGREN
jgi:5-methylcytosine-specific restriction endonuclease McrA